MLGYSPSYFGPFDSPPRRTSSELAAQTYPTPTGIELRASSKIGEHDADGEAAADAPRTHLGSACTEAAITALALPRIVADTYGEAAARGLWRGSEGLPASHGPPARAPAPACSPQEAACALPAELAAEAACERSAACRQGRGGGGVSATAGTVVRGTSELRDAGGPSTTAHLGAAAGDACATRFGGESTSGTLGHAMGDACATSAGRLGAAAGDARSGGEVDNSTSGHLDPATGDACAP